MFYREGLAFVARSAHEPTTLEVLGYSLLIWAVIAAAIILTARQRARKLIVQGTATHGTNNESDPGWVSVANTAILSFFGLASTYFGCQIIYLRAFPATSVNEVLAPGPYAYLGGSCFLILGVVLLSGMLLGLVRRAKTP